MNTLRKTCGQASVELAVFGAIIIFLIGGIVRSSFSAQFQQNTQLKNMRLALLKSYQTSHYQQGAGRNSTSILYIEDRISPDAGRYGSLDRTPIVATGAGTLSNMLMYPLSKGELYEERHIPGMDVYINGKYFYLTTARMVTKALNPPPGYNDFYLNGTEPDPAGHGTYRYNYADPADPSKNISWNFRCVSANGGYYGCPLFYQLVINPGDGGVLSTEEKFNLTRSNNFDDDPPPYNGKPCLTSPEGAHHVCAGKMAWHWRAIDGVKGSITIDTVSDSYPAYDVDNDSQEETIYEAEYANDVIRRVTVFDYQEGDIDSGHDNFSPGPRPGLQNDMAIFTQTSPKTFLKVKEGKLYNPETGLFVRSINNRDQVEIVQRIFQLSGDSGRFCQGLTPTAGWENPVEACAATTMGCFGANTDKTCYDRSTRKLFIRSRISDKRGHQWKTDAGWPYP